MPARAVSRHFSPGKARRPTPGRETPVGRPGGYVAPPPVSGKPSSAGPELMALKLPAQGGLWSAYGLPPSPLGSHLPYLVNILLSFQLAVLLSH
jgi:hypothetical protein